MNRMARHPGPQGGLSLCPGWRGRGDPPLPICPLRVGIIPIAILKRWRGLRRRPGRRLCNYRAHRAQTSAPGISGATCWAGCPGRCAPTLDLREGQTLSPAPPAGSAAQGGSGPWDGWRPGPQQRAATVMAMDVPTCLPERPPGRRPAPPQHQGSREALPRQRLSLRCHALWMRLRASSNFLVEASWMALWGRSTW